MQLVKSYGRIWARNDQNFKKLKGEGKVQGLYILYDGSNPVYVGRGRILSRLEEHRKSKRVGRFWDYFSWYAIPDAGLQKDTEALLIKTLPYYLRLLNKQNESFAEPRARRGVGKSEVEGSKIPEAVDKPKFVKLKKFKLNSSIG